jgi:hypothetical protein
MKGVFLEKCDLSYAKWDTVVKKFQVSLTNLGPPTDLGTPDGIRGNESTLFAI